MGCITRHPHNRKYPHNINIHTIFCDYLTSLLPLFLSYQLIILIVLIISVRIVLSGLPEEALIDLNLALKLDPENKPVRTEITNAKKIISDGKKKEKALYGNIFNKISVYDDKAAPFIPGNSGKNPKVGCLMMLDDVI